MPCPFCDSLLTKYEYLTHTAYECEQVNCLNDDMPRYKMTFLDGKHSHETIMLENDNLYIQINYDSNYTVISKLQAAFLTNTVTIQKALDFNKYEHDCISKLLGKVKMLMVFS